MSGSAQFWTTGTWFFLFYGFVVLAVAGVRSVRMERRYRSAETNDRGGGAGAPDEGR